MRYLSILIALWIVSCAPPSNEDQAGPSPNTEHLLTPSPTDTPYIVVLGIGQDGGAPQAGSHLDPRWTDQPNAHLATSLGLVDPMTNQRWMFEATPDFRKQWYALDTRAGRREKRVPDGIFLTHAHMGHYTGLMFLGHESIGAQGVPVYAMPNMSSYLKENGPWSQLVNYGNIILSPLRENVGVTLSPNVEVRPFKVPHRQEFSEVVGYIISSQNKRIGFIPDIDSWEEWDASGPGLIGFLDSVDLAFVDATFYADGELPGRDMSGIPHPYITHTMARLADFPAETRSKVVFIHLNHTNPALYPEGPEAQSIRDAGFRVATPGEIIPLK